MSTKIFMRACHLYMAASRRRLPSHLPPPPYLPQLPSAGVLALFRLSRCAAPAPTGNARRLRSFLGSGSRLVLVELSATGGGARPAGWLPESCSRLVTSAARCPSLCCASRPASARQRLPSCLLDRNSIRRASSARVLGGFFLSFTRESVAGVSKASWAAVTFVTATATNALISSWPDTSGQRTKKRGQ